MPVGTFVQTVPSADLPSRSAAATPSTSGNNNAATQLSEAIDEFLADLEKKFKIMNDEVLTKCLRLITVMDYAQSLTSASSG
jgi:hypothetical protein